MMPLAFALSQLDDLLLILAVLYLFECVAWLRFGALVCTRFFPFKPRSFAALEFPANDWGGAAPAGLLPMDVGWLSDALPLSFSPQGVAGICVNHLHRSRRTQGTGVVLAWEEVKEVRIESGQVWVGKHLLLEHASAASAYKVRQVLQRLAALAPDARAEEITNYFAKSLRANEAKRRAKKWLDASWPMRVLATLNFLLLFVAIPLCEHTQVLSTFYMVLLGVMILCLHLFIWLELKKQVRAFMPALRQERLKMLIIASFAPTLAMRVGHMGARNLMAGLHPLAVAAGTCPSWQALLAFAWRDSMHPLPIESTDARAQNIVRWHQQAWRQALSVFAHEHGLDTKPMEAPQDVGEIKSFCPRCLATFTQFPAKCSACENMPTNAASPAHHP